MAVKKKDPQIILLDRWRDTFESLTDEEAGQVIKAMFAYWHDGKQTDFKDRLLKFSWGDIVKWFADSRAHYEEVRAVRAAAGQASGESRRNQNEQNEQKATNVDNAYCLMHKVQGTSYNAQGTSDNAGQGASGNDKNRASESVNLSNIQTTSMITEREEKSGGKKAQPAKTMAAVEKEALKITPGNFKNKYQRAAWLNGETVFKLCDKRRDMIRSGADPAEVDREIQKEIDKAVKVVDGNG